MQDIINLVIRPKEKDIGDGFFVRRSLPHIQKKMVGPFIFWDHMGPAELTEGKPLIVRAHPHIGLSTITYLFRGEILHRDSLGNEQVIRPGEVNWMTAGEGIVHSERSFFNSPTMNLEGIQLWLALPKEFEKVSPSFVHHKEEELPKIAHDKISLRLIAGEVHAVKSPLPVFSPLFYIQGRAHQDAIYTYQLKQNEEAAIYICQGGAEVNGKSYPKYTMIIFKPAAMVEISLYSGCEFMFFGGDVLAEDRYIWWNFVASDRGLIEQAKNKWKNFKFPSVVNESEFIPLPD